MKRRNFILASTAAMSAAIPFVGLRSKSKAPTVTQMRKKELQLDPHPSTIEPFELDDVEWKMRLDAEAYYVLRQEGTERPFTSALNEEKRAGEFACTACDLVLFNSEHKYDSGTGWPSFWKPLAGRIETKTDFKMVFPRTEYHCARCGGHQGHLFEDGPKPTGLRYCNNGVALKFVASAGAAPAEAAETDAKKSSSS